MLVGRSAIGGQSTGIELGSGSRYPPIPGWRRHTVRIPCGVVKPDALLRRFLAGALTNVAFEDARRLPEALGFDELRVRGSHHVYARSRIAEQLNLQDRSGQAKTYQLRQPMAVVRRYDLRIEDVR